MHKTDDLWDARLAALWASIDAFEPDDFLREMDALTDDPGLESSVVMFERASARDSMGFPELAVPMYRAALHAGLTGVRRRRANIQLASSLRNLGNPAEAAELLTRELQAGSDELDGAVQAFLALALVDLGRDREAVSVSLTALAVYLPRYNRSLARYASDLVSDPGQK